MTASQELLAELAAALRGPRRARRRLLDEIREDLRDAVQAERNTGADAARSEAEVVARFGDATTVARRWNREHARRSVALRRNVVLVLAAAATAATLGVTQHASGKSSPTRSKGCKPLAEHSLGLHDARNGAAACVDDLGVHGDDVTADGQRPADRLGIAIANRP
jgi:hypothetical protein